MLLAALGVVIVILLITYRSPVLWLFPVICVVFALFSAQGVIYLLAKYGDLTVNAQTRSILSVLVLGAGTDYALLLVARYREELRRHHDRHEAMTEALHRAGPAIIASGSTVIVGMLCLVVADMNSTSSMGPVLAIGVGVVLLAMITLLPALLVIMGRWIFWPVKPTEGSHEPTSTGFWAKTGWAISHRPRTVWVSTSLVLAVMAVGIVTLDATGLSNDEQFVGTPDSVKGERVIEEHFVSAGDNNLQIVANAEAADQVAETVSGVEGVNPDAVTVAGEQDGTALILAGIEDGSFSERGLCHGGAGPRRRARHSGRGCPGRRQRRGQLRCPGGEPARQQNRDPAGAGDGAPHPGRAAAGDRGSAAADRDRGAVVRCGARLQRCGVPIRLRHRRR